jgi:hypothetical protein
MASRITRAALWIPLGRLGDPSARLIPATGPDREVPEGVVGAVDVQPGAHDVGDGLRLQLGLLPCQSGAVCVEDGVPKFVGEGLHLLVGLVGHLHPDPPQRVIAVAVHLALQVVLLDGELKAVGDRP